MGYPEGKRQERRQKQEWGYSEEDEIIVKEPPSPKQAVSKCKPIDEDLYKIPPEFLHAKPKRVILLLLFFLFIFKIKKSLKNDYLSVSPAKIILS